MAIAPHALADTVSIPAAADTFVSAGTPVTSHGSETYFDVYGAASNYGCGDGPSKGLLKFDLSSIPAGAVITSATLKLTSFAGFAFNGDPYHHAIFISDDSWTGASTWDTRPSDGFSTGIPEPTINGNALSTSPDNLGSAAAFTAQGCDGSTPTPRDFSSDNLADRIASERDGDETLSLEIIAPSCGAPGAGACFSGPNPVPGDLAYFLRYYSSEASVLVAPHLEVTYTVGSVTGSASQTPGQANLTKAGNIDWAAWGNGTTNFDNTCTPAPGATLAPDVSKAGGGDTISNLTNIGTSTEAFVGCYGNANPFSFSWTDGDPAAAAAGAYVGISHSSHETGDGYSFTVPADPTTRRLKVWVYAHGGTGTLTAHLSDGASDYVDSSVTGGFNAPAVYTLDYSAASAEQTLTVSWVLTTKGFDDNSSTANAGLYAVALSTDNTYVVDSPDDLPDLTKGDGICQTDSGNCTLRAAIEEANARGNGAVRDRIAFAISDGGEQDIVVNSAGFGPLPAIQDPVVIDGTTEPGYDGSPLIFIDGSAASCIECSPDGLRVEEDGGGSTIRGLAIGNFAGDGIELHNGGGNAVEASWIGTGPGDNSYSGNDSSGIRIDNSAGNRIGGTTEAQRVVLGANGGSSEAPHIVITDVASENNVVQGSYIGLDADGVSSFDTANGVLIEDGASKNTIGGDSAQDEGNYIYGLYGTGVMLDEAGTGNVIAGNTIGANTVGNTGEAPDVAIDVNDSAETVIGMNVGPGGLFTEGLADHGNVVVGAQFGGHGEGQGVWVHGASTGTVVAGNAIGTDRAGASTDSGNYTGMKVDASGVQIGPGNTVAYNDTDGIVVDTGTGNRIVANSIHDNGAEGISLVNGGNGGIHVPVLNSAIQVSGGTSISGSITVPPGTLYFVEFFASASCEGVEGTTYAGFAEVTAPSSDLTAVNVGFTGVGFPVATGQVITATVTGALSGNTSEFSGCVAATNNAGVDSSISTTTQTVKAASRIQLGAVPPAAFLTNSTSTSRSSPINDVPINDVQLQESPVNDIPINDVGLTDASGQLGDVLLSTIPLLREGGWERVLSLLPLPFPTRPVQNVSLREILELGDQQMHDAGIDDLTLADLDLSHSPLGAISAVAYSLGNVTLAQLNAGDSWCDALAGPPIFCTDPIQISGSTLLELGIQGAPINDVPINDVPINDVPINDIPINDVPINEISVANTPINDVPINDVPVNDVAVDTPINEIPVNDVPINDVLVQQNPINEIPINDVSVNGIPVNEVPVNEIPINDVPINDIPINDVPVNEIPVNEIVIGSADFRSIPVNDIGGLPGTLFLSATGCSTGSTLGALFDAGCLRSDVTLGDLRDAYITGDLPDSFTLGDIGRWGDTNILDLIAALSHTPNPPSLAQIVLLVKSYAGTAPPPPTFGDLFRLLAAIDASSSSVNLTLTDIAHLLYGSDATLADLLSAVLSSKDLGWEKLDLGGLGVAQFADPAFMASFQADVEIQGVESSVPVTFSVQLPPGFTYKAGSTMHAVSPALPGPFGDPVIDGETLTWTFDGPAPSTHHFTFEAYPGIELGPTSTTVQAKIVGGTFVPGTGAANVTVEDGLAPSGLDNPQPIAQTEFVLSYISSSADGDAYSLPAPAAGSRVTIHLSHLPVDYDLVVYGPNGQVLVPAATGTPPLDGSAVADPGVTPTHATDALPPQTLNDVPIAAGRTVVGISANRGTQDDAVTFTSQGGATPYVIQISGYNDVSSNQPYMVRAEVLPPRAAPTCLPRFVGNNPAAATAEQPVAAPANVNTLFVVNRQQLARNYGTTLADQTITTIKNRLNTFRNAGFPSSILQVDAVPAVRATYDGATGWNACPSDPNLANAVVAAVDARVRAFKAAKPTLQYVVLVGSDDVIPFARLDDHTTLSNEDAFAGSFDPSSPLGGALASSRMLSDDPYGTLAPIPFFDRQLYVPELGVSRLIETPAQMQAQVNAFTNGQIAGGIALTTGYDFLSDGAQRVSTSLGRVATANATLINGTWNAGDLGTALTANGGQPPNLVSLNAHADDSRFQAANGTLFATDTLAAALTFSGRIVFSMGCHAGLNVPDAFVPPDRRKDWAQTFAGRGASVYVANTGFGYGDSDIVAYSEDLNARFASNLADGMTAGAAFADAKAGFQGDLGLVGVYDEKAMAELTLYGLPMVSITGAHPAAAGAGFTVLAAGAAKVAAAVSSAALLVTTGNDPAVGLDYEEFSVADSLLPTRRVTTARGDYYHGRDGELVTHLRPIEPKATQKIETANAHGALITALTSQDVPSPPPFDPLFARPTVDSSSTEPEIGYDDVAFPAKLQTVTRVKGFAVARKQKLILAQGQFFSTNPADGDEHGVQRLFTRIDGRVFVSADPDYAAPTFNRVDALKTGGTMTFSAEIASGDPVKRVLVLFLGGSSGTWTPVELQPGAGNLWTGAALTSESSVQYFAQAVDSHGNVAVSTNKGYYFAGAVAEQQNGSITIDLIGTQANGIYKEPVTVDATPDPGVTLTSLTVDGNAVTPGSVVSGQGVHTVIAIGSDGGVSTTAFVVDTVGPTVEITSGPAQNAVTQSPAIFTFTASEPATFECHLDTQLFAPCSSPVNYGVLTPGNHTFHVRGTDIATNLGPEATRSWTTSASVRTMIVFARSGDIYSIESDGTSLRQLTSGSSDDRQPVLNPAGTRIVFSRDVGSVRQLFRMTSDGQDVVQLTVGPGNAANPAFSKAGDKLAFDSAGSGSNREILVAPFSPTGTDALVPTNISHASGDDITPAWSPDGLKIAFASNRSGQFEIFTMTATGTAQTALTNDKKNDVEPSYSPDGTKLTFSSNRASVGTANGEEIYVMGAANGNFQVRLTTIVGDETAPFYLDATRIVFASSAFGGGGLAIVAPAGGTVTTIAGTVSGDATPG